MGHHCSYTSHTRSRWAALPCLYSQEQVDSIALSVSAAGSIHTCEPWVKSRVIASHSSHIHACFVQFPLLILLTYPYFALPHLHNCNASYLCHFDSMYRCKAHQSPSTPPTVPQ
jgi:hypothetical protein